MQHIPDVYTTKLAAQIKIISHQAQSLMITQQLAKNFINIQTTHNHIKSLHTN